MKLSERTKYCYFALKLKITDQFKELKVIFFFSRKYSLFQLFLNKFCAENPEFNRNLQKNKLLFQKLLNYIYN